MSQPRSTGAAPVARQAVEVLVLSGSARRGSLNTRLADLACAVLHEHGGTPTRATIADFDTPNYDWDVQDATGFPDGAERLRQRLEASDAFVIASPEYNFSMPGALKNAVDWVSRYRPQPLHQKHGLLLSASPSMAGGNRGLWALRVPLEHLGARVYPDMFSLAQAHRAFTDTGQIGDPQLSGLLESTIAGFLDLAEASKHYPCMKREWAEYLGEPLDAATGRVE
jgi:NAD(P)H-dependent FMN reductase